VAGLLILPGRLLGPDSNGHDVVALSTTAPRPVQAAPVAEHAAKKAPAAETTVQHRALTPVRVPLATPQRAVAVKIANFTLTPVVAAKPKAKAKVKRVVVPVPAATTTTPTSTTPTTTTPTATTTATPTNTTQTQTTPTATVAAPIVVPTPTLDTPTVTTGHDSGHHRGHSNHG
jgi:hypothetical protein